MSSNSFLAHLLTAMRYPDRESAHQELLAAALITDKSLTARLFADAGKVVWPTSAQQDNVWARSECWKGGARVDTEVTPKDQKGPQPRCRFDVVVPGVDVTAIIECKWGAGTSSAQLVRYGQLLLKQPLQYPLPVLVLVSADGAPPRRAQALADRCGMPLVFIPWAGISSLIAEAVGDNGKGLAVPMNAWKTKVDAFTAHVCGYETVGPRFTSDNDTNADGAPDLGATVWRTFTHNGVAHTISSPLAAERIALYDLAKQVVQSLGVGNWEIVGPPGVGPRGDIQCDLAPVSMSLPFDVGHASPGWRIELGPIAMDGAGKHAYGIGAYSSIALQFVVRLYISQAGELEVHIGADLDPYLNALAPSGQRKELVKYLPDRLGDYADGTHWKPTPKGVLHEIHERVQCEQWRRPESWNRVSGEMPTMWQRYFTLRDIRGKHATKRRADRIADAVRVFADAVSWTTVEKAKAAVVEVLQGGRKLSKKRICETIAETQQQFPRWAVDRAVDHLNSDKSGPVKALGPRSQTYRLV